MQARIDAATLDHAAKLSFSPIRVATVAAVLAGRIDICRAEYSKVVTTRSAEAESVSTATGINSKPKSGIVTVSERNRFARTAVRVYVFFFIS